MIIQNKQCLTNQATKKQSGFVILMGLLLLVLGAGVWFGTAGNIRSETIKLTNDSVHVAELERIKTKMLTYAVLNPEVFDAGDTSNPGPGYFPCPDTSGDGFSNAGLACAPNGALFSIGMIPQQLVGRNFSFLSSNQRVRRYWFAVDVRFLVDSPDYDFGALSNRFAPLNILTPSWVDPSPPPITPATQGGIDCDATPAACIAPLTLDGRDDIVMVLFYAGDPIDNQNRPAQVFDALGNIADNPGFANANVGQYLEQPNLPALPALGATGVFQSVGANPNVFNDYVIAITREEWEAAVLSRLSQDVAPEDNIPDLCATVIFTPPANPGDPPAAPTQASNSWFNDCLYTAGAIPSYNCELVAGAIDNIEGQGWRTALGCP